MAPMREAHWDAARNAAASVVPRLAAESVPVSEVDGRTVADDVRALCDLPSFDSSAMDGWAVCGPRPWRVVGEALAGLPAPLGLRTLEPGTCVRIATGAVVPDGTSAIVRWEDARLDGDVVLGEATPGRDIRPAGEECRVGEVVAEAGSRATPAVVGLLAATGHDVVSVVQRPRVALMLLGDELQVAGVPRDGRVRDSLGPQLPGWLARAGAIVCARAQVSDDRHRVVEALANAACDADIVITTGGTADGPRDHLHAAIDALGGGVIVDRVAVKPGHPMVLATIPGSDDRVVPLIGLPGNPHSAVVGLVTLGVPVIDAMLGRLEQPLPLVPTASELRAPVNQTRLIAGVVRDGRFELSPYGGSAMLRGLTRSRGFAVVPPGITAVGGEVRWLRLP